MRHAATAVLLVTSLVRAQVPVPPGDLAQVRHAFEPRPDEDFISCDVTPIRPVIDFAFRFEAGYVFQVPQAQYAVPAQGWTVLTSITPEQGEPTYLMAHTALAKAPLVRSNFQILGAYFLGVGRYSMEATLRDDRDGVCRQQWKVVVTPSHADRLVPLTLPPHQVRELLHIVVPDIYHPDNIPPLRLAVLLNVASRSAGRTEIGDHDRERLSNVLTALLERLPTTSVRVVAFSLEQQKEIFRADSFRPSDVTRTAAAIAATPQTTVDINLLKNPHEHVDFLAGLIRRELDAPDPADTVIFVGPTSRYFDRLPADALPPAGQRHARVFYVRWEAFLRPGLDQPPILITGASRSSGEVLKAGPGGSSDSSRGQPDIISKAVAQLNGKTFLIHLPFELAAAIRKIESAR